MLGPARVSVSTAVSIEKFYVWRLRVGRRRVSRLWTTETVLHSPGDRARARRKLFCGWRHRYAWLGDSELGVKLRLLSDRRADSSADFEASDDRDGPQFDWKLPPHPPPTSNDNSSDLYVRLFLRAGFDECRGE